MSRANVLAAPSFQRVGVNGVTQPTGGLTIREHFAALAMSSLAAHYSQGSKSFSEHVAALAVENADALIAELGKPL